MTIPFQGAIDCDVHITVPGTKVLLPYLDDHWREHVTVRGIDDLELMFSKLNSDAACRPDWRPASGKPAGDLAMLQEHVLNPFGTRIAVVNCMWGASGLQADDLSLALCSAVNDWIAAEWLDRDTRLRASMVVPVESPDLAAQEIERLAGDRRFVQVLMPAMGDAPLGKRRYWPIYEAAERHGLAIGIHAGSIYRHAPSMIGWPAYHVEDYIAQSGGFQVQLASLLAQGVFSKYPRLRVVLIESGVTWLPSLIWRMNKIWRSMRFEVPWLDRLPGDVVRENVRMTIQPLNAPANTETVDRILMQIGSDSVLLFSTDYPHWRFEGLEAMPPGVRPDLFEKIVRANALQSYPRLEESIQ